MGLNRDSAGCNAIDAGLIVKKANTSDRVIALCGNPNVGKSTVFNELTGLRQHTGNWPGKTVTNTQGYYSFQGNGYIFVDLPGCYSLAFHSPEEEAARDFLCSGQADATIIVCDATCLERNLNLVLQTLEITSNAVVCVNMLDEAKKKKINIDLNSIARKLGVPVVGTSARSGNGLDGLMQAVCQVLENGNGQNTIKVLRDSYEDSPSAFVHTAEEICRDTVFFDDVDYKNGDTRIDKILTGKWTAYPVMILSLLAILWLTISGANEPSRIISIFLFMLEEKLFSFLVWLGVPQVLVEMLVSGVYRVLAWVVSVMLPPIVIFKKNHYTGKGLSPNDLEHVNYWQ